MSRQTHRLGDSHNFGRHVQKRDGRIFKPRTVFWEWLLLSSESPLRQLLARLYRGDGEGIRTDFLPNLEFGMAHAREKGIGAMAGDVEHIALSPLSSVSANQRQQLADITGCAIALYSWLGLGDLHWENLALGTDAQGRIVLAPLDVELMLDDHDLPTATRLLPEADAHYAALYRHACGVRRVLPFLGKPVVISDLLVMVRAYHQTLSALDRHGDAIAATLSELPDVYSAPLRVCLRSTEDYLRPTAQLDPPLLAAEREQLQRGDIPYFFRLYGRPGIHYFTDAALTTSRRIPASGDVPTLAPLLSLSKGLRSAKRQSLHDRGLFCLLAAFDHPTFRGDHTVGDLTVRVLSRRFVVCLPDGDELEARRDLRAFVQSVYQPCRCGEVQSVLVPRTTHCEWRDEDRAALGP